MRFSLAKEVLRVKITIIDPSPELDHQKKYYFVFFTRTDPFWDHFDGNHETMTTEAHAVTVHVCRHLPSFGSYHRCAVAYASTKA